MHSTPFSQPLHFNTNVSGHILASCFCHLSANVFLFTSNCFKTFILLITTEAEERGQGDSCKFWQRND